MAKKNIKKSVGRGIDDFAAVHGVAKMRRMAQELEAEKAKVEALAGTHEEVHLAPLCEGETIKFAITGDTHVGSLYCAQDQFLAFLRAAQDFGASCVLHAGDILDGWKVYKGQEFELRDVGFEAQIERLQFLAMPDIPLMFITGNHDQSFKHLAGVGVGRAIEGATGWEYLGDEQATVRLCNPRAGMPDFTVGLYHLGGGTAYALSYKSQKLVESLEGGRKPNMAVLGHFHKAEFLPAYRNVAVLQAGSFQWQTPFMARMASPAHVGGWLVEVSPGETYNRIKAEFIAFYR
jgi:hypothetical protein